jgi:hypothetical protein
VIVTAVTTISLTPMIDAYEIAISKWNTNPVKYKYKSIFHSVKKQIVYRVVIV